MRILQIHNMYALRGGEETVVENENKLLNDNGHIVEQYIQDNRDIESFSISDKISLVSNAIWSRQSYNDLTSKIKTFKPDVCHLHHFYPLLSPSVVDACTDQNIPLVMTLHSYRLICTNSMLYRDGAVCTECVGRSLYHSVKRKCYRDSYFHTFHLAHTIEKARKRNVWDKSISRFIALTHFGKKLFVQGGLPEEKILVKPNFSHTPDIRITPSNNNYLLYFGRLDSLKGFDLVMRAAQALPEYHFVVAGAGPLQSELESLQISNLKYLGVLERDKLAETVFKAALVLFPSVLYEGMGMPIPESFAYAKPILASNIGVIPELIRNGETGILFQVGSLHDFIEKIRWSMNHPTELRQMGDKAFQEFKEKYSPEVAYQQLISIYQEAIETYITPKK